ncbi:DUF6868 family protein [uncultured Oceanicoccus sp.]|uniref:DUF6868 family protein n=1 Tax=uncultured Oceanicoccus sp. TaxID=1706381 RepID=UPI0030D9F4E7
MDSEWLISFFAWGAVINLLLLLLWFLVIIVARDWIINFHGRWFKLSEQSFDKIHYGLLAVFEMLVFIFFITPYLALRFFA